MKVEKQIMYHISRENHWKVGDVIVAGKHDNPFWLACKNYSPTVTANGQKMSVFEMINNRPSFDDLAENIDLLYNALGAVSKEFSFFVREQVFEDYRRENYLDLPSRQKCLWVTEMNQLSYWKTMEQNVLRSLLTLELDGELFCADERWLTANTFSGVEYLERAKHYWAGEKSSFPIEEYLFCGNATIIEVQQFI